MGKMMKVPFQTGILICPMESAMRMKTKASRYKTHSVLIRSLREAYARSTFFMGPTPLSLMTLL